MLKNDVTEKDRELVRKHWKTEAVFIDAWCPGADERKAPEEELYRENCRQSFFRSDVILSAAHSEFIESMILSMSRN